MILKSRIVLCVLFTLAAMMMSSCRLLEYDCNKLSAYLSKDENRQYLGNWINGSFSKIIDNKYLYDPGGIWPGDYRLEGFSMPEITIFPDGYRIHIITKGVIDGDLNPSDIVSVVLTEGSRTGILYNFDNSSVTFGMGKYINTSEKISVISSKFAYLCE